MTSTGVTSTRGPSSGRRLEHVASALRSRGWWLTGVLTLVVALWTIVPWRPASVPADAPYLDPSWMVVLHLAFLDGLAFGEDIVFTYGPWGFVATRIYVPGTFGWLLLWWIVLAASIWYAAFAVALSTMRSALWAALWMSGLLLVVSLGNEASFIAVVVLFVVASAGFTESRLLTAATVVLAALLAWLGLVKFTYFGLGVALVVLVTAWLLVTRRRVGPALPVYLVAWLVFWLAARQPVDAIPHYFVNGLSVAAGYTPAMSLWSDTALAVFAVFAAAIALALVIAVERGSKRRFPVMAVGLGLTLYVAFKAGFVRQDEWHTPVALLAIAVVALATVPLLGAPDTRLARRRRTIAAAVAVATAAGMWAVAPVPGPARHVADIARTTDDTLVFFVAPGRAATSRRSGWSSALAEIRAKVPLPHVEGAVDLYPNDQLVLVANGLKRSARPVFQSYFAYTSRLIALNEAHLQSDRPRMIFVDLAPIDGHWPTSEDASNLVSILSDYRLRARTASYLVFARSDRVGYRLRPLLTVRAELGAPVRVPSVAAGPIWVSIAARPTALGRLEELVLRPSGLILGARLADGRHVRHRLVPAVARSGFLLSPYLADRTAFAAMTTRNWQGSLAESAIETITVRAEHARLRGYAKGFEVSFSRIVLPGR